MIKKFTLIAITAIFLAGCGNEGGSNTMIINKGGTATMQVSCV